MIIGHETATGADAELHLLMLAHKEMRVRSVAAAAVLESWIEPRLHSWHARLLARRAVSARARMAFVGIGRRRALAMLRATGAEDAAA